MDVNALPGFGETYAGIERSFGVIWARRFALAAPLMLDDPEGPLATAFELGLRAHAAHERDIEDGAWLACRALLAEAEAAVVGEAERILR